MFEQLMHISLMDFIDKHDIVFNPFKTEAVIIKKPNQWTGFYMITASVMKGLNTRLFEKLNQLKKYSADLTGD